MNERSIRPWFVAALILGLPWAPSIAADLAKDELPVAQINSLVGMVGRAEGLASVCGIPSASTDRTMAEAMQLIHDGWRKNNLDGNPDEKVAKERDESVQEFKGIADYQCPWFQCTLNGLKFSIAELKHTPKPGGCARPIEDIDLAGSQVRLQSALGNLEDKLSSDAKMRLESAQASWVNYRDAHCAFLFSLPPKLDACIADMNRARAAFFEESARKDGLQRQTDGVDWKRGKLGYLSQFVGTYLYDAVLDDPSVKRSLKVIAGDDEQVIRRNMQVARPIVMIDSNLVLGGNAPHEGMTELATVWVNIFNGAVRVGLIHDGNVTLYASDREYRYIPHELRDFVRHTPSLQNMREEREPPEDVRWVK